MDDTTQPPPTPEPNPDETQVMDWSGATGTTPAQPAGKTSLGVDPNAPIPGGTGTTAGGAAGTAGEEAKKPTGLIIAVVVLSVIVVGLLGWAVFGRSSAPTPTTTSVTTTSAPVTTAAPSTTRAPSTTAAPTTTRPSTTTSTTTTTTSTTTTTTTTQPPPPEPPEGN